MRNTRPPLTDPGGPVPAADAFLTAAGGLAARRAGLVAEVWDLAAGPFHPNEVFARADVRAVDAELAALARDGRIVLAVADLADRVANLEAVAAAGGVR